jgi:hypothetical protein
MTSVSLITYPDFVYSGFQVVLCNADSELQVNVGNLLLELQFPTNLYQLELEIPDQLDYNLRTLAAADLILFNRPNMWHWTTGFVLNHADCFFMEVDTISVNTYKKLSLRQATAESLPGIIDSALQKKRRQQTNL